MRDQLDKAQAEKKCNSCLSIHPRRNTKQGEELLEPTAAPDQMLTGWEQTWARNYISNQHSTEAWEEPSSNSGGITKIPEIFKVFRSASEWDCLT